MKKISVILGTAISVAGCATSGQAVKEHNLLNLFISQGTVKHSALTISEMSRYCSRNLLELETKEFPMLKKATLDYKVKNGNQYFMRIEVNESGINQSKISVYHYMNTEVTRNMATQVEKWVTNNSRECVPGF